MKLRNRVAAAASVAVLVSIVAVSSAVYVSMRHELRRRVDTSLLQQGDQVASQGIDIAQIEPGQQARMEAYSSFFADLHVQAIDANGKILIRVGTGEMPITATARSVAGGDTAQFEDVTIGGKRVRVYNVPAGSGAIRFGQSLEGVDESLNRLLAALVVIDIVGLILAVILGRLAASRAIAPVHELSDAAHTIKETRDLRHRLPVQGNDEVASMAISFNEVLDDLDESQRLQRQLVADASHELRTPLTTLRTNIEVLNRGHDLPLDERDRITSDLTGQIQDLTDLVGDLVDLARGDAVETLPELVRLDYVVGGVVDRARRQRPQLEFEVRSFASTITVSPDRLERAVSNLIDNAAKWSPYGGLVTVTVASGAVTVQDQGPGISPEDLPHIFDRFYRSSSARQLAGSGLGLAIVKQFTDASGGTIDASSAPGYGTTFTMRFPET